MLEWNKNENSSFQYLLFPGDQINITQYTGYFNQMKVLRTHKSQEAYD